MKKTCWQRSYFRGEKTISTRKKLNSEFIRVNTSKRYAEDYEIGRIQTFISEFKNKQLKKIRKRIKKKIKRTRRRNKKKSINIDCWKYYLPYKNGLVWLIPF